MFVHAHGARPHSCCRCVVERGETRERAARVSLWSVCAPPHKPCVLRAPNLEPLLLCRERQRPTPQRPTSSSPSQHATNGLAAHALGIAKNAVHECNDCRMHTAGMHNNPTTNQAPTSNHQDPATTTDPAALAACVRLGPFLLMSIQIFFHLKGMKIFDIPLK